MMLSFAAFSLSDEGVYGVVVRTRLSGWRQTHPLLLQASEITPSTAARPGHASSKLSTGKPVLPLSPETDVLSHQAGG